MPFIVTRRKPVIKLSTRELCRPLPCRNNSYYTWRNVTQAAVKTAQYSSPQIPNRCSNSSVSIKVSCKRMLQKWPQLCCFLLSPHFCLEHCTFAAGERKHSIKPCSHSDSNNLHVSTFECVSGLQRFVFPPHLCHPYSKSLQKYVHVQTLTKTLLKTQNALQSLKFELLSLWCLKDKLEYLWILTLPGRWKGLIVNISFK